MFRPWRRPGGGARASGRRIRWSSHGRLLSRAYKIPDEAGVPVQAPGRAQARGLAQPPDRPARNVRPRQGRDIARRGRRRPQGGGPPAGQACAGRSAGQGRQEEVDVAPQDRAARPQDRQRKTAKAKTPAGSRAAVNAKRARSARGGKTRRTR